MSNRRPIAAALAFGLGSLSLYVLLFAYSDQLVRWAEETRRGDKALFLAPIVIAFLFSWIHGTFTGHFWEVLGFRAAARNK
jgi:hypothetical protein